MYACLDVGVAVAVIYNNIYNNDIIVAQLLDWGMQYKKCY
jgi:hypothetical protein